MWFILNEYLSYLDKKITIDAALIERYEALASRNRGYIAEDDTAVINIHGVLTDKPDFSAMFYGGGNTVYSDIISALVDADNDPSVKNIVLSVDSPGGNVVGMFDAMDAIRGTNKPTKAVIRNMAASAAYSLASQADEIVAHNRSDMIGSVGVTIDTCVKTGDIKEISIANTDSPDKRPDLLTDEGRGVLRNQLDGVYDLLVSSIASGRGVDESTVRNNYGRGRVMLAGAALSAGMIDSINSAVTNDGGKAKTMDIKTFRAEHPDVYAAAVEEGRSAERARVKAHLTLGKAAGDYELAVTAIRDGSELTADLQAEYVAAAISRRDISARQSDDPVVGSVPDVGDTADAMADKIASFLERELGA